MSDPYRISDRGHLSTERRLHAARDLDALSIEEALRLINREDQTIAASVERAIPSIASVVQAAVYSLNHSGRLIYCGAGTSGRLGVLDASECPPTFHCSPEKVVGIIAGGDDALRQSSEGKEDHFEGAADELERLAISGTDTLIGIAAGGTTPYVLGAIKLAKQRGATTALLCCVDEEALPHHDADHVVAVPVGAEVVTGSTRMKAGTATKLVLNMISTATMNAVGKTWGNLMVDLKASNAKLRDRGARIIQSQTKLERQEALQLLDQAGGSVKVALVMALRDVDHAAAQSLLDQSHGRLGDVVGRPR